MTGTVVRTEKGSYRPILEIGTDAYAPHVRPFAAWLELHGEAFTMEAVREYIRELNQREDLAASTVRIRRQAVKRRVIEAARDATTEIRIRVEQLLRDLDTDPETRAPKIQQAPVSRSKVLRADEARAMIEKATPRQKCFIRFLWSTGARVSELCGALQENATVEGDVVRLRIRGKGNKERTLTITAALYEEIRTTFPDAIRYMFETAGGRAYLPGYVSHQVASLGRRVLGRKISAHCLRHSFASRKVAALPGLIDGISRYLGHSSVSITLSLYCHGKMDDGELLGQEEDTL